MQYTILIQYDAIDDIYVARVPELAGCMAHGKTQEEALREISVVIEMWLEEARRAGRPIPQPTLYAQAG